MTPDTAVRSGGFPHGLLVFLCIFGALFALFLILSLPNFSQTRRAAVRSFARFDYAHRGLWDMKKGIPENSIPAFLAAIEAGYGIELDVHLTRDNKLVVFHDGSLKRMCGVQGKIEDMTLAQLEDLRLAGTEYGIPRLKEVLRLVDGVVPILIEIKVPTMDTSICPVLKKRLDAYEGRYIIESFNPFALRWFKLNAPEILRGQLSTRYARKSGVNLFARMAGTALLVNVLHRPDFVAYNYRFSFGIGINIHRHIYHTPVFAWTVRPDSDYGKLRRSWDSTIFEGFCPPNPPPVNRRVLDSIIFDGNCEG